MRIASFFLPSLAALLLHAVPTAGQDAPATASTAYGKSVVSLHVTYQMWDEDRPWAKQTPRNRTVSAVLVDDAHLLTTADVLDAATLITLDTFGRGRQVEPRLVQVDPGVNLALLAIDDETVLADLEPVALATHTPTERTLRTVRWHGQQLVSAASRVTRFEVRRSWGSRVEHAFLHMRTDIENGGWAEPVFDNDQLVAITVAQTKQLSRAIPVEILRQFLDRARAPGPYVGFPALGILWQVNRDVTLARLRGQEREPRGVDVRQIPWGSSGCGVLQPHDILLELAGHAIDTDGYVRHPRLGRLRFSHLAVENHKPGDALAARVLRDGKEHDIALTLRSYPAALDLVPFRRNGPPAYVIAGGLVIREMDLPYLRTWGKDWESRAPITLMARYTMKQQGQTPQHRRVVLITSVLPAAYNIGYQDVRDDVVDVINGRPIGRLEDVQEALQQPQGRYQVIDLAPDSTRRQIVLDAATFAAATAEILATYRIPADVRLPARPLPPGGGSCPGDY